VQPLHKKYFINTVHMKYMLKENLFNSKIELFLYTIFITAFPLIFYKTIFYNFDLHHDGYILYLLELFNKGSIIYKDIFNQYGAIPILFNYFVYNNISNELVNLRLSYLLIYCLINLISFSIAKYIIKNNSLSLISILVWNLSFYPISNHIQLYFHAWPSIIALLFLLTTFNIILNNQSLKSKAILLSIIILLQFNTKINYAFVNLFCILIYYGLLVFFDKKYEYKYLLKIFIFFTTLLIIIELIYFYSMNILEAFINQNIIYALNFANQTANLSNPNYAGIFPKIFISMFTKLQSHGDVTYNNILIYFITTVFCIKSYIFNKKEVYLFGSISIFFCWFLFFPVASYMHIYLTGPIACIYLLKIINDYFVTYKNVGFISKILFYFFILFLLIHLTVELTKKIKSVEKFEFMKKEFTYVNYKYLNNIYIDKVIISQIENINEYLDENIKCVSNLTAQPFYSVIALNNGKLLLGFPQFNWGYVNILANLNIPKISNLCNDKNTLFISPIPIASNAHKLVTKLNSVIQDFSSPVFIYYPSKEIPNQSNNIFSYDLIDINHKSINLNLSYYKDTEVIGYQSKINLILQNSNKNANLIDIQIYINKEDYKYEYIAHSSLFPIDSSIIFENYYYFDILSQGGLNIYNYNNKILQIKDLKQEFVKINLIINSKNILKLNNSKIKIKLIYDDGTFTNLKF